MKKITIVLALIAISFGAQAQTKTTVTTKTTPCKCATAAKTAKAGKVAHTHKPASNATTTSDVYQVCKEKGGHYECCTHRKKVTKVVAK